MLKVELKLSKFIKAWASKELVQPWVRYSSYLPVVGKSVQFECRHRSAFSIMPLLYRWLTRRPIWMEVFKAGGITGIFKKLFGLGRIERSLLPVRE